MTSINTNIENMGRIMKDYRAFLAKTHPSLTTSSWNTLGHDNMIRVLEAIEPHRVPEVLKEGLCPWTWHCNFERGWGGTPSYVKDGWVRPIAAGTPGSCFTVVQWWASIYMENEE
jgi:hypothetical protein